MASVRQTSAGCYDILLLLLSVAPGKSWVQSGADRRGNGSEPCTCETLSFSQLDVADWMSNTHRLMFEHSLDVAVKSLIETKTIDPNPLKVVSSPVPKRWRW
jgi:hypothetical protein